MIHFICVMVGAVLGYGIACLMYAAQKGDDDNARTSTGSVSRQAECRHMFMDGHCVKCGQEQKEGGQHGK